MVLEHQTASDFGLVHAEHPDDTVVIVVSHDCDIANSSDREPCVEVIVGRRIAALGADSHAKTARRLHVCVQTEAGLVAVELVATDKMSLPKEQVLSSTPRVNWRLAPDALVTLQKWLASRYRRSAFADEFERRLKEKPGRLDKKIAKALDEPSEHVLAVLFDVDDGAEIRRDGPNDIYQLRISLLYYSSQDEELAYEATQKAADEIENAFEHACFRGGAWTNIRLLSCVPVSDSVMTIEQSRLLKQWRLDYMSLEDVPQQPLLEQP
ncbi:hypothetical protein OKW41_006283 [Paraburkholderia sp. UCT70]|uniref:hypothetical protein n=1 Tax=Paraburkholderia sp. UCT70 TaxID=2991068 RepID=UPI003D1D0744